MFYGVSKNKSGKEISNYDKYLPWEDGEFSGKINYELDNGENYEVYRNFTKKNPQVFDKYANDISKNFEIDKTSGNKFFYEQTKVDEDLFRFSNDCTSKRGTNGCKITEFSCAKGLKYNANRRR